MYKIADGSFSSLPPYLAKCLPTVDRPVYHCLTTYLSVYLMIYGVPADLPIFILIFILRLSYLLA